MATVDILRDRERGLPRYNQARRQYGLKPAETFSDITDNPLVRGNRPRCAIPCANCCDTELSHSLQVLHAFACLDRVACAKRMHGRRAREFACRVLCMPHACRMQWAAELAEVYDNVEEVDFLAGCLAESPRPKGYLISETAFYVFIMNASRRLLCDRFFQVRSGTLIFLLLFQRAHARMQPVCMP